MKLENFGSILSFAADMEAADRDFYSALAENPALAGDKSLVLELASAAKKNEKNILRCRRENVTEMILERIKDFSGDPYEVDRGDAAGLDRAEALTKAVADGVGPMPLQKNLIQSMKNYNNPYQGPRRVRTEWTRSFKKAGRPIKDINKEAAPVLFYVGCTGAYNTWARAVPQATASIFQKLGLDFGILGENEICCGSTAMRVGDAEEFKRVATENLKTFQRLHKEKGVDKIVTSCAGCYRAIKKDYVLSSDYDRMMDGIEIQHTAAFLHDLYQQGQLKFEGEVPMKVTYHDPCHTGRHLNKFITDQDGSQLWPGAYVGLNQEDCLYDIPRELLQAIPVIELVEMSRIKANSYCCGGGGGVMTGFREWATENGGKRIEEGMSTSAENMVSICPFCHYNLNQGSQKIGNDMKLLDLVELIDRVLPEKK